MSSLTSKKLINALKTLGELMINPNSELQNITASAQHYNAWFTPQEVERSLQSLGGMLNEQDLEEWFKGIKMTDKAKKIGLILAGNIPLVGFHDVVCVLASGNIAVIKMSSSDDKLIPAIIKQLIKIEPSIDSQIEYVDRLKDFDAIIATGSNNSSRYFDYYFGKVPNIIRKNRNSVAILDGNETPTDIEKLGHDIFDYFGLGCRNVSKIYVPKGYDMADFFVPIEKFQPIINHFKYNNNYDYNKSILLVNGVEHLDNGFLLVKKDSAFTSPLAVLHYEEYDSLSDIEIEMNNENESIQCVVSKLPLNLKKQVISPGQGQHPKIWDYADDVNTVEFLMALK
ncbi:MAG: acyl-CoA reductase [Pedobacter sp.]|nr:MAG: acyl-CoA reductase [Pedobacter sp.]